METGRDRKNKPCQNMHASWNISLGFVVYKNIWQSLQWISRTQLNNDSINSTGHLYAKASIELSLRHPLISIETS
jgi:hypothetical protein